ncbi:MAG TPA: tetratricopeptide repeat protein, partial [Ferruginibacter sp.]|nr:tetratricopeptide repeat protein [Ferruginibacter sp.]
LNPGYANAYNDRGIVKYRLNDNAGALKDYEKAIEIDPAYYTAYKNRAVIYYADKKYDAAINDYEKCISLKPNDADGYMGRGAAKNMLKDYKSAIGDFSKAIEYEPTLAVAYLNRGNARFILDDKDGALADYKKVTTLQPGNANVYFNMGVIYAGKNESNNAIAALKKYNSILPNEWNGYKITADVYYTQLHKYDSSEYYYNKAWQINKQEKDIMERYGYSLLNQNKITEAIAMFKNQVAFLPNDPWGYYNLGAAYSLGKQPEASLKNLDIALDKRMVELPLWESDKNLNNVRMLEGFKTMLKKYFNKDILAKYPSLFGF